MVRELGALSVDLALRHYPADFASRASFTEKYDAWKDVFLKNASLSAKLDEANARERFFDQKSASGIKTEPDAFLIADTSSNDLSISDLEKDPPKGSSEEKALRAQSNVLSLYAEATKLMKSENALESVISWLSENRIESKASLALPKLFDLAAAVTIVANDSVESLGISEKKRDQFHSAIGETIDERYLFRQPGIKPDVGRMILSYQGLLKEQKDPFDMLKNNILFKECFDNPDISEREKKHLMNGAIWKFKPNSGRSMDVKFVIENISSWESGKIGRLNRSYIGDLNVREFGSSKIFIRAEVIYPKADTTNVPEVQVQSAYDEAYRSAPTAEFTGAKFLEMFEPAGEMMMPMPIATEEKRRRSLAGERIRREESEKRAEEAKRQADMRAAKRVQALAEEQIARTSLIVKSPLDRKSKLSRTQGASAGRSC
jgi:hypothetical protein